MSDYTTRKYQVVPYDPEWVTQFESIQEEIQGVFGQAVLDIQHVGSTSVPGMEGKPTVDLLVEVADVLVAESKKEAMASLGYDYAGALVTSDSRLFRKMDGGAVVANIHFFPTGHAEVKSMLAIRDYLRANPHEIEEYSSIKKRLAETYPNDYAEYRKQKDQYMHDLKRRASSRNNDRDMSI